MASVKIEVRGLSELNDRMKNLSDKVALKIIRQAVAAGANVVKEAAKRNVAPHNKTGELQASIDTRRNKQDSREGYEIRDVGVFKLKGYVYANTRRNRQMQRVGKPYEVDPPSFYWRFLEFGTRHQAPSPFLRPAFDQNVGTALKAMSDKLTEKIIKEGV
jgi:HK97 gp10 family phage protein